VRAGPESSHSRCRVAAWMGLIHSWCKLALPALHRVAIVCFKRDENSSIVGARAQIQTSWRSSEESRARSLRSIARTALPVLSVPQNLAPGTALTNERLIPLEERSLHQE